MKAFPFLLALALLSATGFGVTFTVNQTGDQTDAVPGDGHADIDAVTPGDQTTLRAAIQEANLKAGIDTITFIGSITSLSLPSFSPSLTEGVIIAAPTPDAEKVELIFSGSARLQVSAGNTTLRGLSLPGGLNLITNGGNTIDRCFFGTNRTGTATASGGGVRVASASNEFKDCVISGNTTIGILITGATATGNKITNCRIGTDAAGTAAIPNSGSGVRVENTSNATIDGCVISGNTGNGVTVAHSTGAATNVTIQNCKIGTNAAGGAALANTVTGIYLDNAGSNTIHGNTISANGDVGLYLNLAASTGNIVTGNRIGTDTGGSADLGNAHGGISIFEAPTNTIGDETGAEGNVISGNGEAGVLIQGAGATGNVVAGNKIGTDAGGAAKLGNRYGVKIQSASNNVIRKNVLSGNGLENNDGAGVLIFTNSGAASGNHVEGNFIGTGSGGAGVLGNYIGVGLITAAGNTIGGKTSGTANVIAFNQNAGVTDSFSTGNAILGNSIFENTGLGIELGGTGVTANDAGDTDTGIQNYPVLTKQTGTLKARLESQANKDYRLEFFSVAKKDPSGNGEGSTFLGSFTGKADPNGVLTCDVPAGGGFISATATEIVGGVPASTSEFSAAFSTGLPLSDLVVDSTGDEPDVNPGDGFSRTALGTSTLRSAIEEANQLAKTQTIKFNIDGAGPKFTITPATPLPAITAPVVIDGTTQFGFAGTPIVILDGTSAGALANGLTITGGGCTVRALEVTKFQAAAIELSKKGGNVVTGCHLIACQTGVLVESSMNTIGDGNTMGSNTVSGIHLTETAGMNRVRGNFITLNDLGIDVQGAGNQIGGTDAAARNIISANNNVGVFVSGKKASGNIVQGNYVGLTTDGLNVLANFDGIVVDGAVRTTIGGLAPGEGNVISGNTNLGLQLRLGTFATTKVYGNRIGTNAEGTAALGNGTGIHLGDAIGAKIGGADVAGGKEAGARNLISGNTRVGIYAFGGKAIHIEGNYIGTNASGLQSLSNQTGLQLESGDGHTVGGSKPGQGNVISGNSTGVELSDDSTACSLERNLIGTDPSGMLLVANQIGVKLFKASFNLIGGSKGEGNRISGNGVGIAVDDFSAGNVIQGNEIGLKADGAALGNRGKGIWLKDGSAGTLIGAAIPTKGGNAIAFNGGQPQGGELPGGIVAGNTFGNAIIGNRIFNNSGLGIDLGGPGVLANDVKDQDDTPTTSLQNYPVLTSAVTDAAAKNITIAGTFNSKSNSTFRLEFFANDSADPSMHGEGQTFLGFLQPKTDNDGNLAFSVKIKGVVTVGAQITATATRIRNGLVADNSEFVAETSEFSAALAATAPTTLAAPSGAGAKTLHLADLDGDQLTAEVAGGGTISLDPNGTRMVVRGADGANSLTLNVEKAGTGDGVVRLEGLTVEGDFGSILAPQVDFAGDGLRVTGRLRTLSVRDILGGADVLLGGRPADQTLIGVRVIQNGTLLRAGSTIQLLNAVRIGASEIAAPALGELRVREKSDATLSIEEDAPR